MSNIENAFFSEILKNFLQEKNIILTNKEKAVIIQSLVNDEELAKIIDEFVASAIYFKTKKEA